MTTTALSRPSADAIWINAFIAVGSLIFVCALATSAYFEPQWRTLHFFQALIYVAIVVLARRHSAWGYGAGFVVPAFWNALLLFRSPVGAMGMQAVVHGQMPDPGVVMQLFAAAGHFLIIIACLVGFARTRPAGRQWGAFAGGGILALAYLLVMAFTIGPPEAAQHIKQALGF